jgi:hypothetical protein
MLKDNYVKANLCCRVIWKFATHHKSILIMSPRLGYMVMHLDVGVRQRIIFGKIYQVWVRRGLLSCTPGAEKTGLTALMPCHLHNGAVLVGTTV